MFEAIADTSATIPASVLDHVQAVFTKAKQLNAELSELTETAKNKRRYNNRRLQGYEIDGYTENRALYNDNLNTLEVDGISYTSGK